jgi:hypothetical protein
MCHLKILGFMVAALASPAIAGVEVLGFEIGESTLGQVETQLAMRAGKPDAGTSALTGGPTLRTHGAGYGVDGITGVAYIFSRDQKLVGVVIDMSKAHFNDTYDALSAKYQPTPNQRPDAGSLFVKFAGADGTIELDGRYQGFDMQARYFSNEVYRSFSSQSVAEGNRKESLDQPCCIDP